MARHPRERSMTRRELLVRGALLAMAAGGAGDLLTACSAGDQGTAPSRIPLASPSRPVRLLDHAKVDPIKDGLGPERGPLRVFTYAEYLSPDVVAAFAKDVGTTVEVTTFETMDEAVARLEKGDLNVDVVFPTPDVLTRLVQANLLQPLNHSYVGNLINVWDQFQSPFYDLGAGFTVPYTVYSTGILYRADLVGEVPANGYDLLWDETYRDRVYMLNEGREVLGMTVLRNGDGDVNTEDPDTLQAAVAALSAMARATRPKLNGLATQPIVDGRALVHQAWSGDAIGAQVYLPEGLTPEALGYWFPASRDGMVANDVIAVTRTAQHPVLAHAFIDFLLDPRRALANFEWVGYQPPQKTITPGTLALGGYVAPNLQAAVLLPKDFDRSQPLLPLSEPGEHAWAQAWRRAQAELGVPV